MPLSALTRQIYSDQFKFLFVGLGFLIFGIVVGTVLLLTMKDNSKLVAVTFTATVPTIGLSLLLQVFAFTEGLPGHYFRDGWLQAPSETSKAQLPA